MDANSEQLIQLDTLQHNIDKKACKYSVAQGVSYCSLHTLHTQSCTSLFIFQKESIVIIWPYLFKIIRHFVNRNAASMFCERSIYKIMERFVTCLLNTFCCCAPWRTKLLSVCIWRPKSEHCHRPMIWYVRNQETASSIWIKNASDFKQKRYFFIVHGVDGVVWSPKILSSFFSETFTLSYPTAMLSSVRVLSALRISTLTYICNKKIT